MTDVAETENSVSVTDDWCGTQRVNKAFINSISSSFFIALRFYYEKGKNPCSLRNVYYVSNFVYLFENVLLDLYIHSNYIV